MPNYQFFYNTDPHTPAKWLCNTACIGNVPNSETFLQYMLNNFYSFNRGAWFQYIQALFEVAVG